MSESQRSDAHPLHLAKRMIRDILSEHSDIAMFPKDCLCTNHKGPHVAHLSRIQAVKNYAFLFEALRQENIPEGMFSLINRILRFSEQERQRQSIFVKDLKFFAADLYPELSRKKPPSQHHT
ncbi:hypothetical protein EBR57_05050 [bacterium]|nr:hypothetical protein [bacterium]